MDLTIVKKYILKKCLSVKINKVHTVLGSKGNTKWIKMLSDLRKMRTDK